MKHQIKKLQNSQLEIEIEISPEELDVYFKQASLNLSKNVKVEGFRQGKVPENILEQKVGKESILVEAADLAVKDNYSKVIKENNLEVILSPDINILKLAQGNPFIFKATVTILPEVKLPDYKKIASGFKKNKVLVEEREVDDSLDWLKKSRTKLSQKQGPADKGDFVEIEYTSAELEANSQKDAFLLGEGHFLPGFENELLGLKAGEEKIISIAVPQDFKMKNIAGKKIEIKVKLLSLQKAELPELNDDFAKSLGAFQDLNSLKEHIKSTIILEKEQQENQKLREDILERISEKLETDIPEGLVKEEEKRILHDFKHSVAEKLKIPFEEYLKRINKKEEEMLSSFQEEAKKRVRNFLALREIGIKEKIEAKEEEIKEEVDKILKSYEKKDQLDIARLRLYTEGAIKNEKIFKLLESFITI